MVGDSISKNEADLFLKVFRNDSLIYDDIVFPRRQIQPKTKFLKNYEKRAVS